MKTNRFIMAVLSACILSISSFGVENNYAPRDYSLVPPSPTVASFLDFQDYPVDYFHGIPNISFPIYSLKVGAIEVPIVLSYHGGGIRTTQKCGNAGLGWTVSFGAEIGHNVCGAPDDANHPSVGEDKIHGLFHLNSVEKSFRSKLIAKKDEYYYDDSKVFEERHSWQAIEGDRYYRGLTDVANDTYSLYGLGLSAVFAYNDNKKIVISSEQPISINHSSEIPYITDGGCDGQGYLVKDQAGLSYLFTTQDRTKYEYHYGSPLLNQSIDSVYYASAWHLDKITDLNGNSVEYNYRKISRLAVDNIGHKVGRYFFDEELEGLVVKPLYSSSTIVYHPNIIESIVGGGITISFDYIHEISNTRLVPQLKSITIKSADGKNRKIEFKYDRFAEFILRKVVDQTDTILEFEYDDGGDDELEFNYNSQDFGGYNNDNIRKSLIPTIEGMGDGADRSVSKEASRKNTLIKIIYPTGGYTQLDWESNDFSYLGAVKYEGDLNDNSKSLPIVKSVVDTIRMCLDDNYKKLKIDDYLVADRQTITLDLTQYYNMNPANLMTTDYEHSHSFMTPDNYSSVNPYPFPHVTIKKKGQNKVERIICLDKETIEPDGVKKQIYLGLQPGHYEIELVNPLEVDGARDFLEANMRFYNSPAGRIYLIKSTIDPITAQKDRNYWCGLRIKNIVSSTGDETDEPIRKHFYYNNSGDPKETSGTVQILPDFKYTYYSWFSAYIERPDYQYLPTYFSKLIHCIGETAFPNSLAGNMSIVEYPQIRTVLTKEDPLDPSTELNTKCELYYYSSSRTQSYCDYNYSRFLKFQPVGARMYTSRSHYRGNLLQKSSYNGSNINTGISLTYDYNIYESDDTLKLATDAFTVCDFTYAIDNKYKTPDYGIGTYSIIPYNKTISFEKTTESDGLTSYKKYDYFYDSYTDRLDYNLIKSVSSESSEGDTVTTYYTYPLGNGSYLPMAETEVTVCGDAVMSAKRTEYDSLTRLPLKVYELNGTADASSIVPVTQATTAYQKEMISRLTYEYVYNSSGNIVEIKYRGVPLVSYIWGYNGMYPVIEAKNIGHETLEAKALSAGLTKANLDGQKTVSQQEINRIAGRLRTLLPDSDISSIYYHWLLGVVETVDARGISTTFDYDRRGRLTEVRDFNDFLINKYEYHYASDRD